MSLKSKLEKAVRNPLLVPLAIKNRLSHLYRVHIVKDEFTITIAKWFRDRGDDTLRLDYPLTENSVVFDLGGYKGDYAHSMHERYRCSVFVFEPVKAFYAECVERFRNNPKVRCFNFGLSNASGYARISSENNASSIVQNNAGADSEEIELKEFKEVLDDLSIQRIDLLKINVEGAEFYIIPHMIERGLMPKVCHLQVQFHNFFPNAEALRDQIREQLRVTHAEKWNYPFVWESWSLKEGSPPISPIPTT